MEHGRGVILVKRIDPGSNSSSLDELEELARSAGLESRDQTTLALASMSTPAAGNVRTHSSSVPGLPSSEPLTLNPPMLMFSTSQSITFAFSGKSTYTSSCLRRNSLSLLFMPSML